MILTIVLFSILALIIVAAIATWHELDREEWRRFKVGLELVAVNAEETARSFEKVRQALLQFSTIANGYVTYKGDAQYEEISDQTLAS